MNENKRADTDLLAEWNTEVVNPNHDTRMFLAQRVKIGMLRSEGDI